MKTEVTTVSITKDDETISTVHVSLEIHQFNPYSQKYVLDVMFVDFDREEHGMWKMELCDQLREQGYSTEYLN